MFHVTRLGTTICVSGLILHLCVHIPVELILEKKNNICANLPEIGTRFVLHTQSGDQVLVVDKSVPK